MHILMIATESIPVPGGGSVEICMLAIARELAKFHIVTLVSRQNPGYQETTRNGNLTIVRVPSGSSGKYIQSVLQFIEGKRFDVVQVDNRPFYMARVKQASPTTPVILFLHSLTFVPTTSGVAACMEKADLIVANSASLKQNLSQKFPEQGQKIRVVHLGVDVNRFKPATRYEKESLQQKYNCRNNFTILFSGRVIPRKGVPVLIQAISQVMKNVQNVKLVVVGGGNRGYMNQLKQQARKLNVPAVFTGRISHQKIHMMYRMADCFVCPSQRHEAFGLVNVEAMASGVPIVASQIGGIREIVKHGVNGYLVNPVHRSELFAGFLTRIALNPALADKLSRQGRKEILRRFSWAETAKKLAALYKTMKKL